MAFIPSIRQCLAAAAPALEATPATIARLIELRTELVGPGKQDEATPGFPEIDDAVEQLRALHRVCTDMAANMRNAGQAYTPPPPAPPKLPGQSVYDAPRATPAAEPRPPIGDWRRSAPLADLAAPPLPAPSPPPPPPPPSPVKKAAPAKRPAGRTPTELRPGELTTPQVLARLGISAARFYKLRGEAGSKVPNPIRRVGREAVYAAAAIDAYLASVKRDVSELQRIARTGLHTLPTTRTRP